LSRYASTFNIRYCNFYADLAEGVFGNLVLSDIYKNTFGYFGSVGTRSRHIYSKGSAVGAPSNLNRVSSNRFYNARGTESNYWESGSLLEFIGNNFEVNKAETTVTVKGMLATYFDGNWFERNEGTYQVRFDRDASHSIDNYVITFERNWFDLSAAGNSKIMDLKAGASNVKFDRNTGTISMKGKGISTNDALLTSYYGNFFPGVLRSSTLTAPTFPSESGTANLAIFGQTEGVTPHPKQLVIGNSPESNQVDLQGVQQGVGYNQNLFLQPRGGGVSIGNGALIHTSNHTGTGVLVLDTSPILKTPYLGNATASSLAIDGGTPLNTSNQTGSGSIVLSEQPAISNPRLDGGITQGSGLKHQRVSLNTTGRLGTRRATLDWASPFLDANYTVTCSLELVPGSSGVRVPQVREKTAATIVVDLVTLAEGSNKGGTLECIAVHD
jgi:hypothetical protein